MINKLFENWRRYLKERQTVTHHFPKEFYDFVEEIDDHRREFKKHLSKSHRHANSNFHVLVTRIIIRLRKRFKKMSTGRGAFRTVFLLDDDYVLKIATDLQAIEQNRLEAQIGKDSKYTEYFTKVFETDESFIWILSERVYPIEDFDKFPINEELLRFVDEIREGTREERQFIWQMMNWAVAELIKKGGISDNNIQSFLEEITKGNSYGLLRFADLLRIVFVKVQSFNKREFVTLAKGAKSLEGDKRFNFSTPTFEEIPVETLKEIITAYESLANKDTFSGSLIKLALEFPDMEIWDVRTNNIGYRKSGEVVILDSSFKITDDNTRNKNQEE